MPVANPSAYFTNPFQKKKFLSMNKAERKKLIDDSVAAIGRNVRSKSSGKLAGADRVARPTRK
jgi:hypothetical protein